MAVGDKNIAVGGYRYRTRRGEVVLIAAAHARFAEPHQDFSVGTELEDLMSGLHAALGRHIDGLLARRIGDPDIALLVHVQAVRPDEEAAAEAFDDLSVGIE